MRRIDGKLYDKTDGYLDTVAGREHAQRDAKKWREAGHSVRLIRAEAGIMLYTRYKRGRK